MKNFIRPFIVIAIIIAAVGCSRKKDRFISRNYHALTTKYNILYNGNIALEKGISTVNAGYKDDYWDILPVEPMQIRDEVVLPGQSKNEDFNKAEEKAAKAAQKHGMNIDGKEKNPQIDEAYLLLGKARYFDQRFIPAIEAFNYILYKYPASDKINNAKVWREKTNIRLDNNETAIINLKKLLEQEEPKGQDLADATAVLAQAYINVKHIDSALIFMKVAVSETKKNHQKGRYGYIKGQLYNHLKYKDSANMAFDEVIKLNRRIPRKYLIGAQIEKAKNFDFKTGDKEAFLEHLVDLSENRENRPFLDRIYHEIGDYYAHEAKDSLAISNYGKSLYKRTYDKKLVALNYEIIGNYNFDATNYKTAGAYYDSTLTNLKKDSKPYRVIKRKRENLDDVIKYEDIARANDSILNLVSMTKAERLKYFSDYIKELKVADEAAKEKKEIQKIKETLAGSSLPVPVGPSRSSPPGITPISITSSTFYFYNSSTVAYGKQQFAKVWGKRKNVDNWKWSSKTKKAFSGVDAIANVDLSDSESKKDSLAKYNPDTYISEIPENTKVIDSISDDRNYAYYQLGLIYKEKFKEYDLAKNRLEDLLNSSPEEKLILPSKYNLYKIYELQGESLSQQKYKEAIIRDYPDSRYAQILENPNRAAEKDVTSPQYLYKELYKELESQNYEAVITNADKQILFFADDPIVPKFKLLKATAIGRLKGYKAYGEALQKIATDYANTKEGVQAQLQFNALTQIADASFVASDSLSTFKVLYKFTKTEYPNITKFKDSLSKAVKGLRYYKLKVSEDVYDAETKFVVVHGVRSIYGAQGFSVLLQDEKMNKVKVEDRPSIAISSANYRIIQIHKNLSDYLSRK